MLGFLTSCSPAAPLNFLARSGDWTVSSDKYGHNVRNGVDIYTPAGASKAPVIVFFYGGNWQSGDKEMYRFVAASLAARGYVVVVPDYRVYPEVRFAGFMQDGAQAVAWTKKNIERFGGDPNAHVSDGTFRRRPYRGDVDARRALACKRGSEFAPRHCRPDRRCRTL